MASTLGLAEPFKAQVDQLLALAGGRITVTSGKRTYAQQAALRVTNGCPDVYSSPASSCRVPTAKPGTSRHESGLAVDLGGDLALAARLAPQVGLKATVKGEPWHFEPAEASRGGEGATSGLVGRVSAAGGDDDGLVDGLVRSVRNLTVTGLVLTGAAALFVMGGYRTVTGRSLAGDTATAGTQVAKAAATGGTSAAAKAAALSKAPTSTPRSARR